MKLEKEVQDKYAREWNCRKEVPVELTVCPGTKQLLGRADLVNGDIVVEIKKASHWKHALGQLISYNFVLERREMWLILFGSSSIPRRSIEAICNSQNVKVLFTDQ